jgi:flagellar hook assembly protein FlgD
LMTDGTSVVAVDVFDVSGKRVHHEEIGRVEAGHTIVELDGRDQAGRLLPSGVYFCRVSAGAGRATQKIILMR